MQPEPARSAALTPTNALRAARKGWIRLRHGRRPYRFLELELRGSLSESPAGPSLSRLLRPERPALVDLVRTLEGAAEDPLLEGVVLDIGPLSCGWASIECLEEAIDRVRDAGKEVHAFLESAGNAEFRLACAADRIHLHPTGTVSLIGLKAEVTLFGEALDRLGVQAELLAVGRYKSAAESFTRDQLSPDARHALASLVGDLHRQLIERVASRRSLPEERVAALMDAGPHLPEEALRDGLVDRLCFRDQLATYLVGAPGDPHLVAPDRYRKIRMRPPRRKGAPSPLRVAWIPLVGTIRSEGESSGAGGGGATAERVVAAIDRAREAKLDAAILRVNSPGGSGLASDVIWRAVERLREHMPVVVSMGDFAASGGYYVAAPATRIVASAGTLTGSIGVFGGKIQVGGLYRKLGVAKEVQTQAAHADILSDARPFSATERERIRAHLEHFYETFLARVAAGRQMERDEVHAVAQGRVWTGRQALDHALTDRTGGILGALGVVREGLDADPDHPVVLVRTTRRDLWQRLGRPRGGALTGAADWIVGWMDVPTSWIELLRSHRPGDALALLPYALRIR